MTKCAIMQPTYLPWAGYFNLIASVDHFVFLDDVQFEKQSWQNRNRVLVNGEAHWLTVPVVREHLEQKIFEIKLDSSTPWRTKHIKLLDNIYSKQPHKEDLVDIKQIIEDITIESICSLNIKIIMKICEELEIKTKFHISSEMGIIGVRSERLVKINSHLGTTYVSPPGAREYLEKDGAFSTEPPKLEYHHFIPPPYPQGNGDKFISHLSVVDIIPRLGWKGTREYVRANSDI